MSINKFRSIIYAAARYMGDFQALTSKRKGAIPRRIGRRIAGRISGRIIGGIFR